MTLIELASGVDALYLSGRSVLAPSMLDKLAAAKLGAQAASAAQPHSFGGYDWVIAPHGLLKWSYRLEHPLAVVGITKGTHLPTFRVQARSEALHSLGPAGFMDWLQTVVDNEGLPTVWTVSRVDLHADWQGWQISGDERHRFVCRAQDLATYEADAALSGFSFGNRKSGSVVARIYDKTNEIKGNVHDWWIELWGSAFDSSLPVHRVEFEFERACLTEMGLSRPEDVLNAVGGLWAYGTRDWLTYREPTAHERECRWPIAQEWTAVQGASLALGSLPLDRIKAGAASGMLRKLMPALNGYLTSFAAAINVSTIADACGRLPHHLRQYERMTGVEFVDRVEEKRHALR